MTGDFRMPVLAAAAWLVVVATLRGPGWLPWTVLLFLVAWGAVARRRGLPARTVAAVLVVTAGAAAVAGLDHGRIETGPVAELARERATVEMRMTVTSDPRRVSGEYGDLTLLRGTVTDLSGRGQRWRLRSAVVVLADADWRRTELGESVLVSGRLAPADGDAAALVLARGAAQRVEGPGLWWRAADRVRDALRESVAHRPTHQRALVPALVVGDDSRVSESLAEDFRTTGLTHLMAVSGTNLTLLVGFLLVLARWAGVRGRWLHVVGALGIAGFVLLARTEPSVVRAAAMGTVALIGLGRNGRQRGLRGLGVAVLALLLVDPWLALTPGFALSALATAGILFLAPAWRDALVRWLPRWVAEAVAVPAAAQLACTPVVAALSGEVSLVAVVANLLAAPVVGPATVLGLAGGLLGLVVMPVGQLCGTVAGWCVGWIVVVAQHGADLPTAAVAWGTGVVSVGALTVLCVLLALLAPWLLARPVPTVLVAVLSVLVVLTRPPSPGWPPTGWVVAGCEVGQGDAFVLRAGDGAGVVIDAGPDPALVDDCLRRLEVRQVPLVVLTHFHADHVDGLTGVLKGRRVGRVLVTGLAEPRSSVAQVQDLLAAHRVPWDVPAYGASLQAGQVRMQVLGPLPGAVEEEPDSGDGEGSAANEASLVLLADIQGVRVLLTGDVEPPGQARLAASLPGLRVDVLKVPHHGSRFQDLDFLLSLQPRIALVGVGEDNDYGHPSADTLEPVQEAGVRVLRTDTEGDVLVTETDDQLGVVTRP